MLNYVWYGASRFTDFPVGDIGSELKREKLDGEGVEFIFAATDVRRL
jgi:hypothetical protein